MNRYTIYCTETQTKKAFELGAPIYTTPYFHVLKYEVRNFFVKDDTCYNFPTVEQMLGWLRSKGFRFKIDELSNTIVAYRVTFGYWYKNGQSSNPKGATLAVIDAALKYLTKNKK